MSGHVSKAAQCSGQHGTSPRTFYDLLRFAITNQSKFSFARKDHPVTDKDRGAIRRPLAYLEYVPVEKDHDDAGYVEAT